jgi:hypothetical protein
MRASIDAMNLGAAARVAKLAWAAPCTVVGLAGLALAVCFGAKVHRVDRTLEVSLCGTAGAQARAGRWLPFRAITLGHVIIGIGPRDLDRLRAHERVHVEQYERWGPLFFIAYAASSLCQSLRGRDPYRDNHFEVEARRRSR